MRLDSSFARIFLIGVAFGATAVFADDATFDSEVAPILARHCVECHGQDTDEAKLLLSSRDRLLYGSVSGRIVVPGAADASLLIKLISPGGKPHMPPTGQLTDAEIATLKKWIDALPGDALPPRTVAGSADHWAYRPLQSPRPPDVRNPSWLRHVTDGFVLARMEAAGIDPAPQASAAVLCRRVYFDLIGLPPTPAELQEFVTDYAQREWAYDELVDRLLASPHYGERWGRHWLDLARYADSSGFHEDIDRPHAWRYRDYVIQSFNEDMPYARFVEQQLAGDEIAPHDPVAWIATGFCRNGPTNDDNMGEGLAREKYRLDLLDDVISTSCVVFLGQTIGCARCHDHKYDPISQSNYYQLLSVFENTERVTMTLNESGQVVRQVPAKKPAPKDAGPQPTPVGFMAFTNASGNPRTTRLLWRGDVANPGPAVQPGVPDAIAFEPLRVPDTSAGRRSSWARWVTAPGNPLTWRVVANRIWQHHFGRGIVATPSNFGSTGAAPSHPELLDALARIVLRHEGRWKPVHRAIVLSATYRQSSRNDAALAVDPQNTWLARRSPHRMEAEILRDAILSVAGTLNHDMTGPGIKPRIPPELLSASQRNKWPVVAREGPQHWRRSVYIYVKRQLPFPLLELFDSPATAQTCERRDESVVPTQALVLMNDEFTQQQATRFADRVLGEADSTPESLVARAVLLALGRQPTPVELDEGTRFLSQQAAGHVKPDPASAAQVGRLSGEPLRLALVDFCHVLFNSNEFAYLP